MTLSVIFCMLILCRRREKEDGSTAERVLMKVVLILCEYRSLWYGESKKKGCGGVLMEMMAGGDRSWGF